MDTPSFLSHIDTSKMTDAQYEEFISSNIYGKKELEGGLFIGIHYEDADLVIIPLDKVLEIGTDEEYDGNYEYVRYMKGIEETKVNLMGGWMIVKTNYIPKEPDYDHDGEFGEDIIREDPREAMDRYRKLK